MICLSILFSFGCAKNNEQARVSPAVGRDGGGSDNSSKPILDFPPLFDVHQLQMGQWIEWTRSAAGHRDECLRWKVSGLFASGVLIEGRISLTCTEPDDAYIEKIFFNFNSGEVSQDNIHTPAGDSTGPLKSIYTRIYGDSSQKVTFALGSYPLRDKKYPSYQLKNQSQVFLNEPASPFHAFALHWTDDVNKVRWTYTLNKSNPEIPALAPPKQ